MAQKSFGKALRADFVLEDSYVPLNHGSFGTHPRVVQAARLAFQEKANNHPDRWFRLDSAQVLRRNRARVAELIEADVADVAFVHNASTGVSTILRSFPFNQGDKVLCFSTAYVNVAKALDFLNDRKLIELVVIELAYPINDSDIIQLVHDAIDREPAIRMCVMDTISSLPGVRFPFEAVTKLVQSHNILALVDGAHTLGQIPVSVKEFDPDFFVSNCHKWLFVPVGCAILYVPKRNQRYVHPLTINHAYADSDGESFNFENEFATVFTGDTSAFGCLEAALDYRASLGGESAIIEYTHSLAVRGGELVAKVLGTRVLQNDEGTLIPSMVNVELPIKNPRLPESEVANHIIKTLIHEHNTMVAPFKHNGVWWARLSAQVYTDIDDFQHAAEALLKVSKDLEQQ